MRPLEALSEGLFDFRLAVAVRIAQQRDLAGFGFRQQHVAVRGDLEPARIGQAVGEEIGLEARRQLQLAQVRIFGLLRALRIGGRRKGRRDIARHELEMLPDAFMVLVVALGDGCAGPDRAANHESSQDSVGCSHCRLLFRPRASAAPNALFTTES